MRSCSENSRFRRRAAGGLCILGLGLFALWSPLSASEAVRPPSSEKVKIISGIVNEQTHAMAKEVVRTAYGRIGLRTRFRFYPAIRSLELANQGVTDGDIARIAGTENAFPALRPVPTAVFRFQGVAFTKTVRRQIDTWEDLRGLRVGVIRGIRYSTIGTKGMNPYFAEDMTHLFRLLANDRIQVAVAVASAGRIEIHRNFQNSGIHETGAPLHSGALFHFVHKKNGHLVEDLDRVLRAMKQSGEIRDISERTLHRLLQ